MSETEIAPTRCQATNAVQRRRTLARFKASPTDSWSILGLALGPLVQLSDGQACAVYLVLHSEHILLAQTNSPYDELRQIEVLIDWGSRPRSSCWLARGPGTINGYCSARDARSMLTREIIHEGADCRRLHELR